MCGMFFVVFVVNNLFTYHMQFEAYHTRTNPWHRCNNKRAKKWRFSTEWMYKRNLISPPKWLTKLLLAQHIIIYSPLRSLPNPLPILSHSARDKQRRKRKRARERNWKSASKINYQKYNILLLDLMIIIINTIIHTGLLR